jgi:nicotinamide mononucleotide (NMN) deamidase PncC
MSFKKPMWMTGIAGDGTPRYAVEIGTLYFGLKDDPTQLVPFSCEDHLICNGEVGNTVYVRADNEEEAFDKAHAVIMWELFGEAQ